MKIEIEVDRPIPDKYVIAESIAIFKCLDDNGEACLLFRQSGGLAAWDIVGMLDVVLNGNRGGIQANFVADEDEDDDGR